MEIDVYNRKLDSKKSNNKLNNKAETAITIYKRYVFSHDTDRKNNLPIFIIIYCQYYAISILPILCIGTSIIKVI